jgi:hypothetical protein
MNGGLRIATRIGKRVLAEGSANFPEPGLKKNQLSEMPASRPFNEYGCAFLNLCRLMVPRLVLSTPMGLQPL